MIGTKIDGYISGGVITGALIKCEDNQVVVAFNAYVMMNDGMMQRVDSLRIDSELINGIVTDIQVVENVQMYVKQTHDLENIEGFVLALWERD